jgi:putative N6-adenine-specific DNA methylase
MCGSGTLLIEAALMATNTAPGLFRRWWPFMQWPDWDRGAWEAAVGAAQAATRNTRCRLQGNDLHPGSLALAHRDAEASGMARGITLRQGGCADWQLEAPPQLVVTNPPWGQRLQGTRRGGEGGSEGGQAGQGGWSDSDDDFFGEEPGMPLEQSWKDLSTFLKRQCVGAQAYVLCGSADASQHLRLRATRRKALAIGGTDCRLLQYEIRGPRDAGAGAGPRGGGSSAGPAAAAGAAVVATD